MGRNNNKTSSNDSNTLPQMPKKQTMQPDRRKEEISLELAELGNLKAKQEPMTPNQRQKSEKEKWYE